jgi:hypothetical protein
MTCTPENLLTLARVVSPTASAVPNSFTVKLIPRPEKSQTGTLSFGHSALKDAKGENEDVYEEYTWGDVLAGDWKLVA